MKLDELFDEYIRSRDLELAETTVYGLKKRYNKRIAPQFANREITTIKYEEIIEYRRKMVFEEELTSDYVNKIFELWKQLFKYAKDENYIMIDPICKMGKVKDTLVHKKECWDINTFNKFCKCIDDKEDLLIFHMLFFLGLRRGELVARTWKDIDFQNGIILIDSQAVNVKGGQKITPCKTSKSNREVYINESLMQILKERYIELEKKYACNLNDKYIVGFDKRISFTTLERKLKKYLELADVPKITLHGFRHSNVTMLVALTNNPKLVADRVGHENIKTTLEIYTHISNKQQRELCDLLENEIQKKKEKNNFDDLVKVIENLLLNEISSRKYEGKDKIKIVKMYDEILQNYA